MNRIKWIDLMRGLSMMAILAFHTEVYYKGDPDMAIPYYVYVTNAIVVFYFISGYLFFSPEKPFNLKRKLTSVCRNMLWPYFFFATILAIGKIAVGRNYNGWVDNLLLVVSGNASWFIVALITAEVIFSLCLFATKGNHIILSVVSLCCFLIYYQLPFNHYNYWQWQDALLTIPFLYAGFTFHQYQPIIQDKLRPATAIVLLPLLLIVKAIEIHLDLPMLNIAVTNAPLFLADTLLTLLIIVSIAPLLPSIRMIEWTGCRSLAYYFLCGVVPLTVTTLLRTVGLPQNGHLYRLIIAFLLVYLITTCISWILYRYTPFLFGIKKKAS